MLLHRKLSFSVGSVPHVRHFVEVHCLFEGDFFSGCFDPNLLLRLVFSEVVDGGGDSPQ